MPYPLSRSHLRKSTQMTWFVTLKSMMIPIFLNFILNGKLKTGGLNNDSIRGDLATYGREKTRNHQTSWLSKLRKRAKRNNQTTWPSKLRTGNWMKQQEKKKKRKEMNYTRFVIRKILTVEMEGSSWVSHCKRHIFVYWQAIIMDRWDFKKS